jgi:formyl-CoA transferase
MFVERPGGAPVIGCPLKFSDASWSIATEAPALGEHTDAMLAEAGLAEGEIAALRTEGIV